MDIDGELARLGPLVELINTNGGEEEMQQLAEFIEETGGAGELLMLSRSCAGVFAVEDDLTELIRQIRAVGALWEANLLSAGDSEEEDLALFDFAPEELLMLAARELSGYELQLWQILDERQIAGFLARECDLDLVLKNAAQLRLPVRLVPPLA